MTHKLDSVSDSKDLQIERTSRDFLDASFKPAEIILFERSLMGDFKALARWLDQTFEIEKKKETLSLSVDDLSRLCRRMPCGESGAEGFAAKQIMQDMLVIEKFHRETRQLGPVLRIVSSAGDENLDGTVEQKTDGVFCRYTGPVAAESGRTPRLGEMWREAGSPVVGGKVTPVILRLQNTQAGELPQIVLQAAFTP